MIKDLPIDIKEQIEAEKLPYLFNFKGGLIAFHLSEPNLEGQRFSFWNIQEGVFHCSNPECNHIFENGAEVLPVPYKGLISNFVCNRCRGMLELVKA